MIRRFELSLTPSLDIIPSTNSSNIRYLEFSDVESAQNAVAGLNGQDICGRSIRLDYSQPRDSVSGGGAPRGGRGGRGGARGGSRGGRGAPRGGRGRGGFSAKPSGTKITF